MEQDTSDGALQREVRFRTLTAPTGVTTDLSGNVYVVYEAQRGAKFTASLNRLSMWRRSVREVDRCRPRRLSVGVDRLPQRGRRVRQQRQEHRRVRRGTSPASTSAFPATTRRTSLWQRNRRRQGGRPIVVGESDQPLSNPEPDCHSVIDSALSRRSRSPSLPRPTGGEAVRFTPAGAAVNYGWSSESDIDCYHGLSTTAYPGVWRSTRRHPGRCRHHGHPASRRALLDPNLGNPSGYGGQPPSTEGNLGLPCFTCSSSEDIASPDPPRASRSTVIPIFTC